MATVRSELAILDLILAPAHQRRGNALAIEVASFLAIWPFGLRNDASLVQAKVDQWCTELERFPLYAIQRTFGWWRRNGQKEPSLAEVIDDVRLFAGDSVLVRASLMRRISSGVDKTVLNSAQSV